MTETIKEMIDTAVKAAQSKKALDIKIMDMKEITNSADVFLVCHAESIIQVKAISDSIKDDLRENGHRVWHEEGRRSGNWILLDYVDLVIHVFQKEYREFYSLERLWGDAKIELVRDEKYEY